MSIQLQSVIQCGGNIEVTLWARGFSAPNSISKVHQCVHLEYGLMDCVLIDENICDFYEVERKLQCLLILKVRLSCEGT